MFSSNVERDSADVVWCCCVENGIKKSMRKRKGRSAICARQTRSISQLHNHRSAEAMEAEAHGIERAMSMMSCDIFIVVRDMFALYDISLCAATATFSDLAGCKHYGLMCIQVITQAHGPPFASPKDRSPDS